MGVNSLPETVTRQRRDCDLNPGPFAPESSTLTIRLPSHPLLDERWHKFFYRSGNAISGRVGRIASEDISLQLINTKCFSILLYGSEACLLLKSDQSSLDFVVG